jgi:hypothetical protein
VLELWSEDPDEPDFRCDDCDVTLLPGALELHYFDDEGPVVFGGRECDPGVFELVCRSRPRTAVLRRSGGDSALEGTWEQGEAQGTWRIVLPPGALG